MSLGFITLPRQMQLPAPTTTKVETTAVDRSRPLRNSWWFVSRIAQTVIGTIAMVFSFIVIKIPLLEHAHPHVDEDRLMLDANSYLNLNGAGVAVLTVTNLASLVYARRPSPSTRVAHAVYVFMHGVSDLLLGASLGIMLPLVSYKGTTTNLTVYDDGYVDATNLGLLFSLLLILVTLRLTDRFILHLYKADTSQEVSPKEHRTLWWCGRFVAFGAWTTIAVGAGFGMGRVWTFPHDD